MNYRKEKKIANQLFLWIIIFTKQVFLFSNECELFARRIHDAMLWTVGNAVSPP